jgi:two-component system sensor histidine kinase GlrK
MPEAADDLQGLLIGQATLVIPLSVGLALLFGVLISRSVRQIDRGIRTLGRGVLREPIQVRGTRDLEELGQRLEWLRRRLVELEAQKAEFLRNVSHELKTPLTNIREATELLLDDIGGIRDSAENRTIADILKSNSVRLQQLIEELLRYGADSAVRSEAPHEAVAFGALVQEALDKVNDTGATRAVRLCSEIAHATVSGNAKHLRVIVDNLLSNAIRYSPRGAQVTVEVRSAEDSVLLDVTDQGPGISTDDAAHLFDWFYTGAQPPDAIIPGTGIGLAIAQEYAHQHAGQIEIVPTETGAHFRLTLPRHAGA